MQSLYSDEIRQFVRTRAWPDDLKYEIREATEPEPHLNIIFFRHNWLTLNTDDQFRTTAIVKEIMDKLWGLGVPTYVGKVE